MKLYDYELWDDSIGGEYEFTAVRKISDYFDLDFPGVTAVSVTLLISVFIFLLSTCTGNYSQVDRWWTIGPVLYATFFVYTAPYENLPPQTLPLLVLIWIWGIRLSIHSWRRGYFNPSFEDHRWREVKSWFPPALWHVFNFGFISFFQCFLLLFLVSPIYASVSQPPQDSLSWKQILILFLADFSLFGEMVADEQHYHFQTYKHALTAKHSHNHSQSRTESQTLTSADVPHSFFANPPMTFFGRYLLYTPQDLAPSLKKGFLTQGLFSLCRHPNFFCEISFWWLVYLCNLPGMGLNQPFIPINYTILGPLALHCIFFFGSVGLTEALSAKKYGKPYEFYQATVPRLLPNPFRR